jgi:hypothetical protein
MIHVNSLCSASSRGRPGRATPAATRPLTSWWKFRPRQAYRQAQLRRGSDRSIGIFDAVMIPTVSLSRKAQHDDESRDTDCQDMGRGSSIITRTLPCAKGNKWMKCLSCGRGEQSVDVTRDEVNSVVRRGSHLFYLREDLVITAAFGGLAQRQSSGELRRRAPQGNNNVVRCLSDLQ